MSEEHPPDDKFTSGSGEDANIQRGRGELVCSPISQYIKENAWGVRRHRGGVPMRGCGTEPSRS